MSANNGNYPAMPQEWEAHVEGVEQTGLTKREYFAGLAMQGLLSAIESTKFEYEFQHETLAMDAVASADALLAELERNW
jgi:hypothetical protein